MFGSAFLSIYSLLQKYDFFVVKTKNGEAFPRQLSFDMVFSFPFAECAAWLLGGGNDRKWKFSRDVERKLKLAAAGWRKSASLWVKNSLLLRENAPLLHKTCRVFLEGGVPLCGTPRSGTGKSLLFDSQLGENEEDRDEKTLPPPTVGHTVGRERRKKNVCTGSDYFFCAFTGAAGCSTSAL